MNGWTSGFYRYHNTKDPRLYIEVVTYENDGHFYYKRYTEDTYDDYKYKRIRKSELLELLKDYVQIQ